MYYLIRYLFLISLIVSTLFYGSGFAQDELPLSAANPVRKSPAPTDRLTPPPPFPVTLDAEFGLRDGVFVRYPFFAASVFAGMVDEIQDVAKVYIVVQNTTQQNNCINYLTGQVVPIENLIFIHQQTNTIWIRDYGPWFVWQPDSSRGIIDMPYAWSPSWTFDDYFPEFLESYWGWGYYGPNIWHDGGNMMTDGHGKMMMSTYVNESNPGMSNQQICEYYQDYFGQDTIYIFQAIAFDLTGHIDLWAKIMNDTTILVAQMQPGDANYQLVENHAARMATIPTVYGTPFHIVRCPMPALSGGYYKSYLNSLLVNKKALVPIYNLTYDQAAIDSYQVALGPDWDVVGIDCNGIAFAGGAIHCTSIAVPLNPNDYLVDVDFTFEPDTLPIIIPEAGGTFNYFVQVDNLGAETIRFDFWVEAVLPNGEVFGPVLKRTGITLPQLGSVSRNITQIIPANAPPGSYEYNGYVGSYAPRVISAEAGFEFEKLGVSDGIIDKNGWVLSGWDEVISTGLPENPTNFKLYQAYPNPFNQTTVISYKLQAASHLELAVYDVTGREMATLVEGYQNAGNREVTFDAKDFVSGVYFVRLTVDGGQSLVQKVVLMK